MSDRFDDRVRVLQVLGRSAGGIARHVATLSGALDGDDGISMDVAGPTDLPVAMPRPVTPLEIPDGPLGHRKAVARLRELLVAGGYDLVHAHGLRAGIDAGYAAKDLDVAVVATIHNLVRPEVAGRTKAMLYKPAERIVVKVADRILAVSRDIARELEARRPDDSDVQIEVLHLGIDPPAQPSRSRGEIRADLGLGEDDPLVVTASRLSPQKALHVMLAAVAGVRATLAILGEGPLEPALREQARSLEVGDRVRFLGFRADVTDYIAAADAFCLSSVWEGVPLAAMEAAGLGVPIVATAVGGTPELVEDRVSGRLVPPNDPAALAAALSEVLDDRAVAERYAAAAKRKLSEEFDTGRMLSRVREIYEELSR